MTYQAYFLRKIKLKIIMCHLLQFLFGALRVQCKTIINTFSLAAALCNIETINAYQKSCYSRNSQGINL